MTARFDWKAAVGETFTKVASIFFPNTVTFYAATQSFSPTGAPLLAGWGPVVGLMGVPALIMNPASQAEGQAGGGALIIGTAQIRITLPFFTTALTTDMRVTDEAGIEYEVQGWEYDPAKVSTVVNAQYRSLKGENR